MQKGTTDEKAWEDLPREIYHKKRFALGTEQATRLAVGLGHRLIFR